MRAMPQFVVCSCSHSAESLMPFINIVVLQMKFIKCSQYVRLAVRWTLLVGHRERRAVSWLNAYCHPPSTIHTAIWFLIECLLMYSSTRRYVADCNTLIYYYENGYFKTEVLERKHSLHANTQKKKCFKKLFAMNCIIGKERERWRECESLLNNSYTKNYICCSLSSECFCSCSCSDFVI